MADLSTIKGRIQETIYPNGAGAIKAADHRDMLLELVDEINDTKQDVIEDLDERFDAKQDVIPDLDARFDAKQDVISDLATIRAGAQKGATAVQPEDLENYIPGGGSGEGFDTTGYYPEMSVGTADNLIGRGESVPAEFSFRASGGKSIKDGRARIKSIKGNSVVWNQQVDTITPQDCELSETDNRLTLTPQGSFPGVKNVVSMNIIENHVYICISHRIGGGFLNVNCGGYDSDANVPFSAKKRDYGFTLYYYGETQPVTITRPILIDLTQMFGAGDEPTTIEEFYSLVPSGIDLFAYNEGEVIHCNTESIKSVGDNAYNKDRAMQGTTNDNTGEFIVGEYATMVDLMACLPNTQYYFANVISYYHRACVHYYDANMNYIGLDGINGSATDYLTSGILMTPANARFMRVGTYVNATEPCMVTLVHSGWKQDTDAGYQEYWEDTLPLSIIRKYFPDGMKLAGSAHDEIRFNKASGKWEKAVRMIGNVDLGSLDWNYSQGVFITYISGMNGVANQNTAIMARYSASSSIYGEELYNNVEDKVYKTNGGATGGVTSLAISDSSYTDAATFKAAMAGVPLYYELAEPIVTEIDEPFGTDYRVADFGTEQAQSSVPSAAFRADIIYQFNAVDMIREHEMEINELQQMVSAMQAQLASMASMNDL